MGVLKLLTVFFERPFAVRSLGALLFLRAVGGFFCPFVMAQSDQPTEYEVKAAFLFNFTKFVEWPEGTFGDPNSPIVIGILGDDPFGDSLTRIISGQKAQGRNVLIVKYRRSDDLRHCQVLFISDSERKHSMEILAGLEDASVLTVSDIEGFAEAGGVMQFVMQDNRVHFEVNLEAATQNKLRVSAKLLALARVINHGGLAR